jgi:hypothetical protein
MLIMQILNWAGHSFLPIELLQLIIINLIKKVNHLLLVAGADCFMVHPHKTPSL